MRIIRLLVQSSMPLFIFACVASVLTGICSTVVIKLIHNVIQANELKTENFAWQFAIYWVGYGVLALSATYSVSVLTQSIVHRLRVQLSRQILNAEYQSMEENQLRLIPILTEDIKTISYAIDRLPSVTTGLATVTGLIIYMAWLSPELSLATFGIFFVAYLVTRTSLPFVRKYAEKARESWNDIFVHLENLVVGIKELSMNKDFRTTYMDDLLIPKSKIQNEYKIRENLVSSLASKTTDMILLLGIAILIIVIGRTQFVEISFFGEYLTLVLFTVAPLSSAAGFLGSIKKIEVALEQVERAGMSLNDLPGHEMLEPGTNKWTPDRPILELRSVEHEYYHVDEEENFNLGPIDLAIRGGEILFLIGGNGSGKTTLAKLISGLYTPKSGEVYYKNQKVKPDLVEDFRDRFSAIFTDSLVFEELLHLKKGRLEKEGKELIEAFGLKKKVRIENGRFTTTKLSEGQRKRLGLIKSFLEDKEIYLFDEWAANQDPSFKEIFYTSILAKLKDKGKAVIVITHDDQYFDLADKTVKLMNGKLSDLVPAN